MRRVRVLIGLLAAMLLLSVAGVAAGADEHRDPAPLLDKMLVALGGEDRLTQVETVEMEATGTRWILDEGFLPGAGAGRSGDYGLTSSSDLGIGAIRLDYAIDHSTFGPRSVTEVFDDAGGFIVGRDSNVAPPGAKTMLSDRWLSVANHQLLMNPHLLVSRMADGLLDVEIDRSVRLGGQRHDILIAQRFFGPPLEVVVNHRTGLIKRIETVESDPLRRDTALVIRFGPWRDVGSDFVIPGQVTVSYGGSLVQREFRHEVTVNGELPVGLFVRPDGLDPTPIDQVLLDRGANSHQHLQSFAALGFPLDGLQLDVLGTELSDGVHHLTGGTHHSMLVEHDDGLILVDAPLNEYRAHALLGYIDDNFPDQPITHIVQSHHHADHAAGVRTIVATGADLVVQRTGARFWSRVLRADSDVVFDAPPVQGVVDRIHTVPDGGSVTVGSGPNAVEVHSFDQNHSADTVLTVAGGVAFIVDYYNPFPGAPLPPEGQVVLDVIADRDLDVHTIAGGHGAFVVLANLN